MIRVLLTLAVLSAVVPASSQPDVLVRDTGTLYFENVPETPAAVREALAPYLNVRSASFADWLPEGGLLVRTRLGETAQVFRVAAPGARREQLTFFGEPVPLAAHVGHGDSASLLLMRDVSGSEDFQLFLQSLQTGQVQLLTDGEARHGSVVVSRGGQYAAYYNTRRNGTDWDIYRFNLRTGNEEKILQGEGAWVPLEWSFNDEHLLLLNIRSTAESYPWILDLATGDLTALSPTDRPVAFRSVHFGSTLDELLLITDLGRDFLGLFSLDVPSGELTLLLDIPWDITDIDVSPDGRELVAVVNEAGFGRLLRLDLIEQRLLPMPVLPDGVASSPRYSPDGEAIAFNLTAPDIAGDVFSIHLPSQRLERWTYSEMGGLPSERFVHPELIHYPTFDDVNGQPRHIPAWVYRPRAEGPHPVIVEIHGGPAAQRRPGFSSSFQYWVNELGIAVVAPNVRGSSGYGNVFLSLDDGVLREDAVRDIGALLDWIETQPDLDAERVMVYGASYGGYMVLASLMHFGDRLAGGVNSVGISNFVTFLENTRAYRRALRRAEYGDERDPEMRAFLESISPANQPERLTRPLFVIHGLNDPRVPASEAEQLIAAMRSAGHNPWYLLARNEGHGFRRQSNRIARAEAETMFFKRYLLQSD